MNRKGSLLVVSGFSGAGKGTLMKALMEKHDHYALSISMTTRQPRPGERDGVEYFFVSKETFEQEISVGGLLEYASYVGHYYGTPRKYVEEQLAAGKDVILEIEVQGAKQIKLLYPEAVLLFVMAPSAEILKGRLIGRGTEKPEVIAERLERACKEAETIPSYDFVVVNDDLDTCVQEVDGIIMATHNRPKSCEEFIDNMQNELSAIAGSV